MKHLKLSHNVSITLMALLVFLTNTALAQDFNLPAALEKSFARACLTEDTFVINAVRDAAKARYVNLTRAINDYWAKGCEQEKEEKIAKASPPKVTKEEQKRNWKASIDAGLTFATGNTKQENGTLNTKFEHEVERWKNVAKFSAVSSKENNTRTSEEYRLTGHSRYKWRPKDYFFGEAQYVNDRYSGHNYRISETVGYGHIFIENDLTLLEAEGSAGGRHTSLTNNTTENSLSQKLTGRFKHKLTSAISFDEEASVSFSEDATISESVTSLETKLVDDLYLKFSVHLEHISEVPAGTKNTDTLTSISLGYHF